MPNVVEDHAPVAAGKVLVQPLKGLWHSQSGQYAREGRAEVDARIIQGAPGGWFKPGAGLREWFMDFDAGPEMVVAPAGCFLMGSPDIS
jgi:hypothetical protein